MPNLHKIKKKRAHKVLSLLNEVLNEKADSPNHNQEKLHFLSLIVKSRTEDLTKNGVLKKYAMSKSLGYVFAILYIHLKKGISTNNKIFCEISKIMIIAKNVDIQEVDKLLYYFSTSFGNLYADSPVMNINTSYEEFESFLSIIRKTFNIESEF